MCVAHKVYADSQLIKSGISVYSPPTGSFEGIRKLERCVTIRASAQQMIQTMMQTMMQQPDMQRTYQPPVMQQPGHQMQQMLLCHGVGYPV